MEILNKILRGQKALIIRDGVKELTIAKNTNIEGDDGFFIEIENKAVGTSSATCVGIEDLKGVFKDNVEVVLCEDKGLIFPLKFTTKADDLDGYGKRLIISMQDQVGILNNEEYFAIPNMVIDVIIDFCENQL